MEGKLFFCQCLIWVLLLLAQLHGCRSCVEKEKIALLELYNNILLSPISGGSSEYDGPSWLAETISDCCRWNGLECNSISGRVSGISFAKAGFIGPSLLNLSLLHPFEDLRSLNLSDCTFFSGFFDDVEGSSSLKRLQNLEILDLSSNEFNTSIFPFLNAATSLTTLFLRDNRMVGSFHPKELDNLTNLELLDLSGNGINSSVSDFTYLKRLKALDLSRNSFSSSMKLQELKNLTNLEVLSLAQNFRDGPLPLEVFCEMKNLRELDLRENYFVGQLPRCLGSLNKLRVLDLSSNQVRGNLPSSFSSLESLEYLSLSDNNFTGLFSLNPLTNLTKLKVFKLSSTSHMLQVETQSTWQPKFQLRVVVLRSCNLEKIPSFLEFQRNLRLVDLSSNRLSGNIPTWLLANNPELEVLQLQNNSFTSFQMPRIIVHNLKVLDFSANNIGGLLLDNIGHALPNLIHLNVSNNRFKGHFPSSMGEMNLSALDLSYNNFSGKLPRSFFTGCFPLKYLKLSHNRFSGHFLPNGTGFTSLKWLRIDHNLFSGKIGVGLLSSTGLLTLDMSKNCLTGAIPSWISEFYNLDLLLLSNNFLEGTVPSLLRISYLDLSGNLLSGALPHGPRLSNLFLGNNNFTGPIPDTLLENVEILDLRNNKLSGSIPQFVNTGSIPQFVNTEHVNILLLSGNSLSGSIPRQLCDLSNIRILDLSDNKLSGFIPSCLYNISFGRRGEENIRFDNLGAYFLSGFYLEFYKSTFLVENLEVDHYFFHGIEIKFATKQSYYSYTAWSEFRQGILGYMYGMDLSNNELSGAIPAELGDLLKLRALNLSHNLLTSFIPSSFSNLKDIESLDLSHNMLQGRIPHQLTSLTSLAVFDVSYNNLSGIVPQGRQFSTFDENYFLGNPLLCGTPTNRSCEAKKSSEEAVNGGGEEEEASIDMLVFYISTVSTYTTALIGVLLLMCIDCPWRRAWLRIVDAFIALAKSLLPYKA